MRIGPVLLVALALTSCETHRPRATKAAPPTQPPGAVEFLHAGDGDVAEWVRAQIVALKARRRVALIYVGASWCEPCRAFHRAAEKGQLDSAFPNLTFLEFDADRDGERLANAGYYSKLIPLFAAPADDGRATGRQIEGGMKGEGAEVADEIAGRLRTLVN